MRIFPFYEYTMVSLAPATFPPSSPPSSAANPNSIFTLTNPKLTSPIKHSALTLNSHSKLPYHSALCRCHDGINIVSGNDSSDGDQGWSFSVQELVSNGIKKFNDFSNSYEKKEVEVEDEDWGWDRWMKYFTEIDEQERRVSILKSQLTHAISREDYENAARFKVAIAATATNDPVGRVMSHLNKAVEEERYEDAALLRDYASAGLVGWWAGVSNGEVPSGRIIRISAEHGRYLARSYSPQQLATSKNGSPLFEIFIRMTEKGEYKEQAVYLKERAVSEDSPIDFFGSLGSTTRLDPEVPTTNNIELFKEGIEDSEDDKDEDDESDISLGSGFEDILRDVVNVVKVKVFKVMGPGKVDQDLISEMARQISEEEEEEEDEEKDADLESVYVEYDNKDARQEGENETATNSGGGNSFGKKRQIEVNFFVGGFMPKNSSTSQTDFLRVPATLEKKSRLSFCFTVEEDNSQPVSVDNSHSPLSGNTKLERSLDNVMLDLAKSICRGKIPMKVLKDVGELLSLTLGKAESQQPLSGSTTFYRIDVPASSDPLNGLYIGAHGLNTSEVVHIRHKFGCWEEESGSKDTLNLEFYEYIEAVKLVGDSDVPAGEVAFRAKVGKRYQLSHKGIIREEFGVVARYKGQGRLAEPGFQNPRWVDGEVVVLEGKYVRNGPVIGFVYTEPEHHFLTFFNQLRLQE